jgi:hypothetical protein
VYIISIYKYKTKNHFTKIVKLAAALVAVMAADQEGQEGQEGQYWNRLQSEKFYLYATLGLQTHNWSLFW